MLRSTLRQLTRGLTRHPAARPAKPPRRVRLGLEALEDRAVPSAYISGGYLIVAEGGGTNTVYIDQVDQPAGASVTVWENGQRSDFAPGQVTQGVKVYGSNGRDTFNVDSTSWRFGTTIYDGYGDTTVNIGFALLSSIWSSVSVVGHYNPSANAYFNDTLNINDQSDASSNFYQVFNDRVFAVNNNALEQIYYSGQTNIYLNGGTRPSTTYFVSSTSAITEVTAHGPNANVLVGENSSVQGIQGPLYINNPPYGNTIRFDDSADTTARTVVLFSAAGWDRLSGLAPALISYNTDDTSSVTVLTGTADWNQIWVESMATTTNLVSQAVTVVNLGTGPQGGFHGTLAGFYGPLNIENVNQSSHDFIEIFDDLDYATHVATESSWVGGDGYTWTSLIGLTPYNINWRGPNAFLEYIQTGPNTTRQGF